MRSNWEFWVKGRRMGGELLVDLETLNGEPADKVLDEGIL